VRRRSTTSLALLFTLLALESLLQCGNDDTGPSCDDLSQRAYDAAAAAAQNANRDCSADSDCILAEFTLRCLANCDALTTVASSALSSLHADLKQADATYCKPFASMRCPLIPPPCDVPDRTRSLLCRDGQCTLEYGPS
jgi:hypothetical protein